MASLKVKLRSLDDETPFSHKKIKVGSKSIETPAKSLDIGKTTKKDPVSEDSRGINEIYFKITPKKLKEGREGKHPHFKKKIGGSLNKAEKDEFNIIFPAYDSQTEFNDDNLFLLVDTVYSTSDFVTIPLMPSLVDAIRKDEGKGTDSKFFQMYKNNIKRYIKAVRQIDGKPIIGTLPAISWNFTKEIVDLYLDKGIRGFCFDFLGRTITAERQLSDVVTPLMRKVFQRDLQEDIFLYAMNAHKGRSTGNFTPARDFLGLGFGFDILGDKHIQRTMTEEVAEKLNSGKDTFFLFNKNDYIYNSYEYEKLQENLPSDTGLNEQRITNKKSQKYKFQALINAEQQSKECKDLKTSIDENRVTEYVSPKRGAKSERIIEEMKSSKKKFKEKNSTQVSLSAFKD